MDVRKLETGGEVNITSSEINRMPQSTRDFLNLFVGSIIQDYNLESSDGIILQGCDFSKNSNGDVTVLSGYVYLGGEVLTVEAGTTLNTSGTGYYIFELEVQNDDPNGARLFRDGNTKNIYEKRVAKIISAPSNTSETINTIGGDNDNYFSIDRRSDWNIEDVNHPAVLKNKPSIKHGLGLYIFWSTNSRNFSIQGVETTDFETGTMIDIQLVYYNGLTGAVEIENKTGYDIFNPTSIGLTTTNTNDVIIQVRYLTLLDGTFPGYINLL